MDNKKDNRDKQKSSNLKKTFPILNKPRKRELKKFIQNSTNYQHISNGNINNKSASTSPSSHYIPSITYYGRTIKSRIPKPDIINLKKEVQANSSSFSPKRLKLDFLFREVEGDCKEIESSTKGLREVFARRGDSVISVMDIEPKRSINLKPLKSGSSSTNTSRISSPHVQRSSSPNIHKSMLAKEKPLKKKKSNNKIKNNDSGKFDITNIINYNSSYNN
jgi:hypothetical protein